MELSEVQKADKARWEASCQLFATLPGADRLIAKYGKVPTFHDGEIEEVHLTKSRLIGLRTTDVATAVIRTEHKIFSELVSHGGGRT